MNGHQAYQIIGVAVQMLFNWALHLYNAKHQMQMKLIVKHYLMHAITQITASISGRPARGINQ